jgi:hypothetical protein
MKHLVTLKKKRKGVGWVAWLRILFVDTVDAFIQSTVAQTSDISFS